MNPTKYDNDYELYELVLKDEEDEVFALSLVNEPAIGQLFHYFNTDGKLEVKFATADEDQHTIVGPILIPDLKILRLKDDGTPYYVTFSKNSVKQIAQKYIKDNNANNITLEHEKPTNGVSLVESWIVDSAKYDKSKAYGLTAKPGTWMGVFKVENPQVWAKVKSGDYRGISLEGLFSHVLIKANKVEEIFEKELSELSEIEAEMLLGHIRNLIKKDNRYKSGQKLVQESHSDYGSAVRNNAKKGIALNEKNGNKCATQTGKVRAQQLAKGDPVSIETIKRMYSYLSRAEVYYDQSSSSSDCGFISYLLWGGKSGLSWSRNKLRELGLLEEGEAQPSIASSYPGEGPKDKKDYTHPALIGQKK